MSLHKDFILTQSAGILKEASSAMNLIGHELEAYPLGEYILQSVFLKLAGAQQQKMNCILWELGTDNYQFRYSHFIKKEDKIGECSTYDDKQRVYHKLLEEINSYTNFDLTSSKVKSDKQKMLDKVKEDVRVFAQQTNFENLFGKQVSECNTILSDISTNCFMINTDTLFNNQHIGGSKSIKGIYDDFLYRHRNRCAHNTSSYQSNFPTLHMLENSDSIYNNYFLYFAILLLIDEIMIYSYKKYVDIRYVYG